MKKIFSLLLLVCPLYGQSIPEENKSFHQSLKDKMTKTEGMVSFPSINGRPYRADCSGYISFVTHWAGLDLQKLYGVASNGVKAIWEGLKPLGFEVEDQNLQVGDIVFFHNTLDKNKNGLRDDEFTHIGIIDETNHDGVLDVLHYGSKGVVRIKMNLQKPSTYWEKTETGKLYFHNSYLRQGSVPENLTGALYAGSMRLVLVKKIPYHN